MKNGKIKLLAIWVITPNGILLANKIVRNLPETRIFVSRNIKVNINPHQVFENLAESVSQNFHRCSGHVFIMSTGIVVRIIAPLIRHKTRDPAVVVVDDGGNHAISLLSGHLGGANKLARKIADIIGARAVITTATDVNQLPAIDILASESKLAIENPDVIKAVNMAILTGETIGVHDPYNFLADRLPTAENRDFRVHNGHPPPDGQSSDKAAYPGVYIDDVLMDLPDSTLVLRPASLVAGIGCNRNTETDEIRTLLENVLGTAQLSLSSLACLASIDVKADEDGLLALGRELNLPLVFFKRHELNRVMNIENPSTVVEKHVGVKSVCEAAAILAARNGRLVVPKHKTPNATVAIARIAFS